MNANKQDAGGLPNEMGFEQWYAMNAFDYPNNPIGCRDCSIARKAWHAALEAARDGELCRAAPSGGDSWPLEVGDALLKWNRSHPAGPLISIGYEYGVAAKVAEIMRDTAPAGSGEVDEAEALREFTEYFVKNYPGPHTVIMDPNWHAPKIFRAAKRALLRKLQQGADGVDWRAHYRFQTAMRYMDNNDKMTLDRAQRMADEDIVRMERAAIAASQGQEGGHASVD